MSDLIRDYHTPPQLQAANLTRNTHALLEQVKLEMAPVMYNRLMQEITDFQSSLNKDEEVGAYLASFGREHLISIDRIGYREPYLVIFHGWDQGGLKVQLVQHVSQVNVLFIAMKVNTEEREPRRIGFETGQKTE